MKKIFLTALCVFALQIAAAQTNRSNTDSQTTGQSPGNPATIQTDKGNSGKTTTADAVRKDIIASQIGTVTPPTDTKNNNNTSPSTSGNNRSAGNISSDKNSVSDPTGTGTGNNNSR